SSRSATVDPLLYAATLRGRHRVVCVCTLDSTAVPPAPHPLARPGAGEVASGSWSGWRTRGTAVPTLCWVGGRRAKPLQPARQHPLLDVSEIVFALCEVGLPRLLVPDLHPGARPDHDEFAVQPGVFAQVRWDGDPPLLVRDLVVGAGEKHPAVSPGRLVRHRLLAQLIRDPAELGGREHVETALLPFGDHDTSRQVAPEPRRKDQPTFFVQARSVGAEEHRHPPPLRRWTAPRGRPSPPARHCTPLYSTSLHRQRETPRFDGVFREEIPRQTRWSSVEGECAIQKSVGLTTHASALTNTDKSPTRARLGRFSHTFSKGRCAVFVGFRGRPGFRCRLGERSGGSWDGSL